MIATNADRNSPLDMGVRFLEERPSSKLICERLWLHRGIIRTRMQVAIFAARRAKGDIRLADHLLMVWLYCPAAFDDLTEQLRDEESALPCKP